MNRATADVGVGPGQVDELEQAPLGIGFGETAGTQAGLVDRHELARLDLADERRTDDVQRRRLARHHPATIEAAKHQGPDSCGSRAAYSVDSSEKISRTHHRLFSTLTAACSSAVGIGSEQGGDQSGVGCVAVAQLADLGADLLADQVVQRGGVGEVAVVGERDGARRGRPEGRLGVLPAAAPRRRVARVPTATWPTSELSVDSSKTWLTRPMSL